SGFRFFRALAGGPPPRAGAALPMSVLAPWGGRPAAPVTGRARNSDHSTPGAGMTTLPRRRPPPPDSHPVRPTLVRLDDRTVPTILLVTNTADSGTGSLREALALANDGDEVRFDSSLTDQAIELTSGQLTIEDSITITGLGADHLAVERVHRNPDGSLNPAFRIFEIVPNETVTITDLTVRQGLLGQVFPTDPKVSNGAGGGIFNHELATLTVTDALISGNGVGVTSLFGGTAYAQGGGLHNEGTAGVTGATRQNNTGDGNSS